jgi:rhodanese-related sulfurtransferase
VRELGFDCVRLVREQLQQILAAQPDAALLDVRTPVEFAEVHIPQARNVPLDELKPSVLQFSKSQPLYLLCRSGQRATKAAEKFAKEGYSQPIVVEGGTLAWIDTGLPASRSTVKVISLERQVRIASGSLVLIGVLLGGSCIADFSACRRLSARD